MKVSRLSRLALLVVVALGVLGWGVASATGGGRHPASVGNGHGGPCQGSCADEQRLNRNKRNVVNYYTLAFNDNKPELAVELYGGDEYIQHNPLAANGFDAFIAFVHSFKSAFPDAHIDIKRVIAEGDLVVTHSLATGAVPVYGPNGSKVVDIFRLDPRGKIVEHWDVLAQISSTSANGNPEV
jgi:predicted SnoaL-like aldol condensation-catalyzing enzyme